MQNHLKRAEALAKLLDNQFSILNFKFGIDPIIGLIPGGDFIPAALSVYLLWIGHNINLPKEILVKMYLNVVADLLISVVPFFGDAADFIFKSNNSNIQLLKKYQGKGIIEGEILES